MKTIQYKGFAELIPEEGMILKHKETSNLSESISLGCGDSIDNYTEIPFEVIEAENNGE